MPSWKCIVAAALTATAATASHVQAQEFALKAGVAVSRFDITGNVPFDESYVSTSFGAQYRMRFGPVALQPEVHMISRGGKFSVDGDEERVKLEYIEFPLLLVVPFQLGRLEPYLFGGPWLGLETRCRYTFEEEGLKTNLGCESAGDAFDRKALDYGVAVGGGAAHRLGSGKLMLEARHTRGLRNIYDGAGEAEVLNRSFVVLLGYTINLSLDN